MLRADLPIKRHALGGNLYLEVRSVTSRQWLFIYSRDGKERSKGLWAAGQPALLSADHAATVFRE